MNFEIVKANIVNIPADAIVLPANPKLMEGSGASTAIFQAAGRKQLTEACKKIGSCEVGAAVPTLAFKLSAKYIIHAVVPKWIDGDHNEYELLSSAYLSSLKVTDIMGCESIAFPLLASGNNGYDPRLAFQIAKESFESFSGSSLKKITLVLFGERITSMVISEGHYVAVIPDDLLKLKEKPDHIGKFVKMADEGKEIVLKYLEDRIQEGLEFLKNKENMDKLIADGIRIARMAIKMIAK